MSRRAPPLLALLASFWLLAFAPRAEANPKSLVIINGKGLPVYYNDGDTFRVLEGKLAGSPARLAGFNTLETFGPAHQWKGWTFKELYVNSKQATLNARRGVWHCSIDPSDRDGYGRLLAVCPDLQLSQIRQGLAHAMSVDGPAEPRLIQAQREAIVNRRGMWAKGVPAQVLTSLHSVDERPDPRGNYNRLVSPIDGYSTKWLHQDTYGECQDVCHPTRELPREAALRIINAMRRSEATRRAIHGVEDVYLMVLLNEYTTLGRVPQIFDPSGHRAVTAHLAAAKAAGAFNAAVEVPGACMRYVKFERRYRYKPDCLKW